MTELAKTRQISSCEELKPCPFCGSDMLEILKTRQILMLDKSYGCHVFCLNCGGTTGYRPEKEAIALWNRRMGE